jgi:hypothetical protein
MRTRQHPDGGRRNFDGREPVVRPADPAVRKANLRRVLRVRTAAVVAVATAAAAGTRDL